MNEKIKNLCDEITVLCIKREFKRFRLDLIRDLLNKAREKQQVDSICSLTIDECEAQAEIIKLNNLINEKDSNYKKLTGKSFVKELNDELQI